MTSNWKDSLAAFFTDRADVVGDVPTMQDLCYVSGRDPRIWLQQDVYLDLIASIVEALHLTPQSKVLEVGSASGFVALGLAPRVGEYLGVDVSDGALSVARRLRLPNATFQLADGNRLPFPDDSLDAALCYDVYTNFPQFEDGAGIIKDMFRVIKPGGRLMMGSIPDLETRETFNAHAAELAAGIEARFGPPIPPPAIGQPKLATRVKRLWRKPVEPGVVCYDFRRGDFAALGRSLGAEVLITDIHQQNPYVGYRFNAIYRKPE